MLKRFLFMALLFVMALGAHAQRFTDNLDHGIVAVNLGDNTFVSWRRNAQEYFGTTYNLYCNGSKVAENLSVTNWTGNASGTFTVRPVVNGVEQGGDDGVFTLSSVGQHSATAWNKFADKAGILNLTLASVVSRDNRDVTHHYWPNDMIFADLDGDGQLEFILKRINIWDADNTYPTSNTTEYTVWEAYDVNWATGQTQRMWWIDSGPNMVSLNSTENNLLAFDWDMDGRAEVVMRGADNMVFHHNDGTTEVIGNANVNTRGDFNHNAGAQYAWTMTGNEYLIYFNGSTGATYQVMDYPLKRYEDGENPNDIDAAWHGRDQYGHISSKYFFGAPYLDGRKPSLFIGRGIYTRHKMMALDVDPSTHKFAQRWEWHSTANGNTPGDYWYGNGNHNYVIADVDEDGRDEIVYGSMVIDDDGQGLHSTGFGHGDAMHVNDFDPYRKGLEIFTCIEDIPTRGMAYRSGLTGEVYVKFNAPGDDGRCMAGNFTNSLPGSVGKSWHSNALALSSDNYISDYNLMFSFRVGGVESQKLNYRIYWDGDLLSEQFDGIGSNDAGRSPTVFKWNQTNMNSDRIIDAEGLTINGTKNNPNFLGDILGDWREEFVLRASTGTVSENGTNYDVFNLLKVYTTAIPTDYSIYTLWADHQYRQAMGTQMQCYNLPPNASFFLGEMEGITQAPPPLTNSGRVEVRKNGTISSATHGQLVMLAETGNASVSVENGAAPLVFIDNVPCWVQGHNASEATGLAAPTTTVYTHTLTGAPFSGSTHVVKQGGGTLVMPNVEQSYSGATDVWAGTLKFDGKMTSSPIWLNRFTTLSTIGGEFNTVTTEYGSEILPGGSGNTVSTVTINKLNLGFGSKVVFDLNGTDEDDNDQMLITELSLEKKTDDMWTNYGPENLAPVFSFKSNGALEAGKYPIGSVTRITNGSLDDIIIEGIEEELEPELLIENGTLYLKIGEAEYAEEPVIEIIDMVNCDFTSQYPSSSANTYYLPKVGIVGNASAELSGTFTSLDGTETDLGSTVTEVILDENYENATGVSPWVSQNASTWLSLVTGDATHGKYISFDFTDDVNSETKQNDRSAYWLFSDVGTISNSYVIEFDASIKGGTDNRHYTGIAVMAGGSVPQNVLFPTNDNKKYLFNMSNGGGGSTSFNVNEGNGSATIPSATWCHYRIEVDVPNRTTKWTITNGNSTIASGTYVLDESASTTPSGIYFEAGRYYAVMKFDNLHIETLSTRLSEYTFTQLGTLRVKASVNGKASSTAVFTVDHPYVKAGGTDYLIENFEQANSTSPWECHTSNTILQLVDNDAVYGKYLSFTLNGASGSRNLYRPLNLSISDDIYTIEFDASSKFANQNPNQIAILSGGLPTVNSEATGGYLFMVKNEGAWSQNYMVNGEASPSITIPDDVWCHYTVTIDKNKRVASWRITNNINGATIGSGSYVLPQGTNTTATYLYFLAGRANGGFKVDNIVVSPYDFLPVSIGDELAVVLPTDFLGGNAHIWRDGLTTATSWSSLVLPFDLSKEKVKELFGENTVVANLITTAGTEKIVYFDTQTGTVTANHPVLIKGVTNASPYLVKDVDVSPVPSPYVENQYFKFIGNYDNLGLTPFYKGDYFFVNNKLSKVSSDGVEMTLKGFRAYFHTNNSNAASVSVLFDTLDGVVELDNIQPVTYNVYTISGLLVRRNASSLQGLRPGLYIVNGKKMLFR